MLVLALGVAFLFGITNKLADLMNEHGVRWFQGGGLFFGVLWGGLGVVLMVIDSHLTDAYLGLILSWFLARKLDYPNHALAGVMMTCAAFLPFNSGPVNGIAVTLLVAAYAITGYIQHATRGTTSWLDRFWRLRLRLYLIPLIYSVVVSDPLPFLTTLIGMIGVEIVTNYYAYKGVA